MMIAYYDTQRLYMFINHELNSDHHASIKYLGSSNLNTQQTHTVLSCVFVGGEVIEKCIKIYK
jgi:hypothetical protein